MPVATKKTKRLKQDHIKGELPVASDDPAMFAARRAIEEVQTAEKKGLVVSEFYPLWRHAVRLFRESEEKTLYGQKEMPSANSIHKSTLHTLISMGTLFIAPESVSIIGEQKVKEAKAVVLGLEGCLAMWHEDIPNEILQHHEDLIFGDSKG